MRGIFITLKGVTGQEVDPDKASLRGSRAGVPVLTTPGARRRLLGDPKIGAWTQVAPRGRRSPKCLYIPPPAEIVARVIRPALLQEGCACERFYDSTTVYQGMREEFPFRSSRTIKISTVGLAPINLVLDLKDLVFHARLGPKKKDKIESRYKEYHRRSGKAIDLAQRYRKDAYRDASLTEDESSGRDVCDLVHGRLERGDAIG